MTFISFEAEPLAEHSAVNYNGTSLKRLTWPRLGKDGRTFRVLLFFSTRRSPALPAKEDWSKPAIALINAIDGKSHFLAERVRIWREINLIEATDVMKFYLYIYI